MSTNWVGGQGLGMDEGTRLVADLAVLRELSAACRAASDDLQVVARTVSAVARPDGAGRLERLLSSCEEAARQAVGLVEDAASSLNDAGGKLTLGGETLAATDSGSADAIARAAGDGGGPDA